MFMLALLPMMTMQAQNLTVKSILIDATDITASTQRRLGPNGNPCALLKIHMVDSIMGVDGKVAVGNIQRVGTTTWIYVPDGTFGLSLNTAQNGMLDINFEDYGYDQLKALTTYVVTVVDKRQLIIDEKDNPTDAKKQYELALDYELSRNGRPKSNLLTKRWMTAAAEQGLPEAMLGLGRYYVCEEHDTIAAIRWMEQAAEKELVEAQYCAADLILQYSVNDSLLKQRALPLMERAARQGYTPAMEELADIYQVGKFSIPWDDAKAIYWLEQLSASGDAEADYQIGWLYSRSLNLKLRDQSKAKKWYRSAAKKGIKKAERRLEELKHWNTMLIL